MRTFTVWAVSLFFFALASAAFAQGPPQSAPVNGSGTPGTVPLWVGAGRTLSDSHIRDNGTTVTVSLPVSASASGSGPTILGNATNGLGVSGFSSNNHGVRGVTNGVATQPAGVAGFGVYNGVLGVASATDFGWGVKGVASGFAVGVEGLSPSGGGVRGQALVCDTSGCSPTNGDAGQFVAGAGGVLLHGFVANCVGFGCWEEKFKVDAGGNLYTSGNAYKPGGGSWSTLSDVRAKKSVEPIGNALTQLLKLRGVTFEYSNPSAFGELAGAHIGMVAQDVEQAFPSWVDTGTDGYKRLTFRGFEAVTVEAIRDLKSQTDSRIESLKQENAELRRQITELSEAVRALTAAR